MKKKQIEEKYNNYINLFKKYNNYYYNKNKPVVSDREFDELKLKITNLEEKYNYLKSADSPKNIVGHKPSKNFKKVFHKVPMLSLSNAFTEEDLLNFLSKNHNHLITYATEPKIDGISASLTYKNGKLVTGLSRGDGKEGEDITANLSTIEDIPKEIDSKDFPEEIDIRGEVFIKNSDFEKLKEKFANPRNAASGSLRQKNSEDTKKYH